MKHTRILGLLALAAVSLLAMAGAASATEVTSPPGTKLGVGTKLIGESQGSIRLDGSLIIECSHASGEGEIANAGGASATVQGSLLFETFEGCGSATITTISRGTGYLHSLGNGEGTATSTGARVTVLKHAPFSVTIHCIYETNETDIGRVTDSSVTGGTAKYHTESAAIPGLETDFGCGSTAEITGTGILTSPDSLYID